MVADNTGTGAVEGVQTGMPDPSSEKEKLMLLYRNGHFVQLTSKTDADLGKCCEELKSVLGLRKRFPGAHHVVWLVRFLLSSGVYDTDMYLKQKVSDNVFITYTVGFVGNSSRSIRVCMEPENLDGGSVVHCGIFGDVVPFPIKMSNGD